MSEYEAIAFGFQQQAERIKAMCVGKPPQACAQLLAMADQYESHAEALLARRMASASHSLQGTAGSQNPIA